MKMRKYYYLSFHDSALVCFIQRDQDCLALSSQLLTEFEVFPVEVSQNRPRLKGLLAKQRELLPQV